MPPILKIATRNPMVKSMLTLALITLVCLVATILVLMIPYDLGRPYEAFETGQSYLFDPWEINLGRVYLSYPEGGVFVGAYRQDALTALVLLAEGTIHYMTEEQDFEMPVEQVVLHMHPSAISVLRGQTYIEAHILPEAILEARTLLEITAAGEPTLEVFGVNKVFLPRPGIIRLEAFGEDQHYQYLNAQRSFFLSSSITDTVFMPHLPMYPPNDQFMWSLTIILVMVLAVALGLVFVTPDYPAERPSQRANISLVWTSLLLAAYLSVEYQLIQWELSLMVIWGWRIMVVAAMLWLGDSDGDAMGFLGLKPHKPLSGIGTGILCGLLLFLCGSIALPSGIAPFEINDVLESYGKMILHVIFFQELIWRGFVQGSLRQHLSPLASIAITTAVFSFTAFLPFAANPTTLVLIQVFFIGSMTSFILGFAYERTGNLYTPIAALSMLHLLPLILQF